jgi:ketosteroid isomerase-like protein
MSASDLGQVIEANHRALDAFANGDPKPLQRLFSRRDDVTVANPFGPPARGWTQVAATMERAAVNYREGGATGFERVSEYASADLAYIVEVERFRAKVGGGDEIVPFALRVTTIFRREDGAWKIVHRHADPITAPRPPESVLPDEGLAPR